MKALNGRNSELYMRFEKILTSAQGMAVWEDKAFILYDSGLCGVYDLESRDPQAIARFPLGSCNTGIPTKDYRNHANSCMFGSTHYAGNPIPLLYVNTGTGTGYDEDGYFYRCAVEDIIKKPNGGYRARTIQTITYHPEGIAETGFAPPCWGCPAWLVDTERRRIYIFSARYRTKRGCVPEGERNQFLITAFRLPEIEEGSLIRLTPGDILDQFGVDGDLQFTQGGTIVGQTLYFTFGCPKRKYPLAIAAFDLKEKKMDTVIHSLDEAFGYEEIECCALYQEKLLCNTCDGGIYMIKGETDWR